MGKAASTSTAQKDLGIFDEQREERRVPIQFLDGIYQRADELRHVFKFYWGEKGKGKPVEEQTLSAEGGAGR